MASRNKTKDDLREWLLNGVYMYNMISKAVDITALDMPVISNDPLTLLHTYQSVYGKQKNRHGGFNTAEKYVDFMKTAEIFAELPEVDELATRIERARSNLAIAVGGLSAETVTKLGYELREHDNKLMVFFDEKEE